MFNLEKLAARLQLIAGHCLRNRYELTTFDLKLGDSDWCTLEYDRYWGEWQKDFLLRGYYQIPESWSLDAVIALELPIGDSGDGFNVHPEALIYVDDIPFTTVDAHHNRLRLPPVLKDYQRHELRLDGWTGLGGSLNGDYRQLIYIRPCALVIIDESVEEFVVLARNVLNVAMHTPADDLLHVQLVDALTTTFNQIDTRYPLGDAFYASIPHALILLKEKLRELGNAIGITIHAAGHAHIDTAWLWTLAQTRRKAARTFHTVLHLMEQFPNYHFTQSQPQLYEFIREDHPDLFQRIREAIKTGRWEPIGGMWVEADCNITGAESLVRQFLLGRAYYDEHFGTQSPVVWLPDTFGFPATFPQIMHEAGIRYFFTTKLRWNEQNDFPYDSFWWEGSDGTRVLAHITPTPMQGWLRIATYNAEANGQAVLETWQRMKLKDRQKRALMAYGWGDGGGGPDAAMLENLAVLQNFPGIPQVKQGKAVDFFKELEHESDDKLPTWKGELYLETHQGTLTSQAWIKRANRKTEVLLHDAEYVAVRAMLLDQNYQYPQQELDTAWRTLLLNQFHDILPGSSIADVYAEAKQQFAELTTSVQTLRDQALDVIARHTDGEWIIVNTTDVARPVLVIIPEHFPDDTLFMCGDDACLTQAVMEGTLVYTGKYMSPFSVLTLRRVDHIHPAKLHDLTQQDLLTVRADLLDNGWLRAQFNEAGHLISLLDVDHDWELLEPGKVGNQFQLFEDRPLRFDAWNIDPDYEARMWTIDAAESIEVVETGPIRATIKFVWRIMNSTITQHLSLYKHANTLEARTHIDWQERNMLLKVAFPANIREEYATYHIQWGSVRRPTHRSTPWDAAKYEVAAHHWADLGNKYRGVTLINDCKYAYDVHDNVIRLTLLKGATYPDPHADLGEHEFTYWIFRRQFEIGTAFQAGYENNYPLLVYPAKGETPGEFDSLIDTHSSFHVETIKRAENGMGIVIRLYTIPAPLGSDTAHIRFNFPVRRVWRINLMEEKQEELTILNESQVSVPVRTHQIISLLIEPGNLP